MYLFMDFVILNFFCKVTQNTQCLIPITLLMFSLCVVSSYDEDELTMYIMSVKLQYFMLFGKIENY